MPSYKVTVLEFAYGENVPQTFYLGDFGDPDVIYPVHPFTFTLLQGEGKNILIDTGMDTEDPVKQKILEDAHIGHAHSPKEVLATVDLAPEDIDAVILTHAHFDHAGALDCYPNAVFYLQEREYIGWLEYMTDDKYSTLGMFSMDKNDITRLTKLREAGRLVLLRGDKANLFPGISVVAAAFGHSFGMQMVHIETDGMLLIHAGDVANRPENLLGTEKMNFCIPNTKFSVGAPYYTITDYDRLMRWTYGKLDRIIMSHDGTRRERFPGCIGPLGLGIYNIC